MTYKYSKDKADILERFGKHTNPISNHVKPKKPEHLDAELKLFENTLEILDSCGPSIINWENMKHDKKDRA